jgi:hypothetical protein
VTTVHECGVEATIDPDVIRAIDRIMDGRLWVLVTMDNSIVEDHPGFEWERYAIAWVLIDPHLRGAAAEQEKHEVIHRHVHQMVEQRAGDHFSYNVPSRFTHPPSLVTRQRRERRR